jgi:hypothetical protein
MKRTRSWPSRAWAVLALSAPVFSVMAADPPQPAEQRNAIAEMQARRAALPDTPGTGKFSALKEEVASLPDHVIYRPAQLDRLGSQKLGLYIFGNGACSNDGASARLHLLEIASHGYLAIAPGRLRSGPGATAPRTEPPRPATQDGTPPSLPPLATKSADLTAALDWALKQNDDPKSPYHNKIDPQAVAVSGYSCGGLQALEIAKDRRIKTVVIMNSGIFNPGSRSVIPGMNPQKSLLETLHTPTLYILGGETDIAYPNGTDDVKRINHVPVFLGNVLNVGHGGTYWEPNGGKAAVAVVAWLDWQLRNDPQAAKLFIGKNCGLCTDPAWSVEKKKIS